MEHKCARCKIALKQPIENNAIYIAEEDKKTKDVSCLLICKKCYKPKKDYKIWGKL